MGVWLYKLDVSDVFHNDSLSLIEKRNIITKRIRTSAWAKTHDEYSQLTLLLDELAEVEDDAEFDSVWDCIYDIADKDKCWIKTY